jgi:MFS family permease
VLAGSVLIGTLMSGLLVDRVWAPIVACLFSLGPLIGCGLMLSGELSFPAALVVAVLIGASQGAEIDVVAYLSARYFGMRHYSAIYGSTVATMALAGVVGQVGIGYLHDYAGSYRLALMVMMAILALSIPFYLLLGPYPDLVEDEGPAGGQAP